MIVVVFLIFLAIIYYKLTAGSDNAKYVKQLTRGKNQMQKDVITYFVRQGCGANTITDEQYLNIVSSYKSQFNTMQRALQKIGLDQDEVNEIAPVYFEGFRFNGARAKINNSGKWVSSIYETAWIFFSDSQVHVYRCRFNLADDTKTEITNEYFYKDVTSFTTISEEETTVDGQKVPTETFAMRGAGIDFECSLTEMQDFATSVSGMKQKLREKKNA